MATAHVTLGYVDGYQVPEPRNYAKLKKPAFSYLTPFPAPT
jgi:hypothetical protein